jgi:hypothetical protein
MDMEERMPIEENGSFVGSDSFGSVDRIAHIPILRGPKEEWEKYCATEKKDSPAAVEMLHYKSFAEKNNSAYNYITGIRHYEVEEEGTGSSKLEPIRMLKYVFLALCVMTGAALLYFKLF